MGLDNSACLVVTPASMDSVLSASLPLSTPRRERRTIPFVVAVDREAIPLHLLGTNDEDIAGADFKGYFNVAVESLLEEFYLDVSLQMRDLHTLSQALDHEDDIWFSSYRGTARMRHLSGN